jgi:hypothetical protein
MDDAFAVRRIERVGDLHRQFQQLFLGNRSRGQAVLEGLACQHFHDNEKLAVEFRDLVNGADAGMVQRRRGPRFAPESLQSLWVLSEILGQEFEGNVTAEVQILGFIDHTHPAAANLLNDAVMRNGLVDHRRGALSGAGVW